jgi:hypothetical protein
MSGLVVKTIGRVRSHRDVDQLGIPNKLQIATHTGENDAAPIIN